MKSKYISSNLLREIRNIITKDANKDSSYCFTDAMIDVESICTKEELPNCILYITRGHGTHTFFDSEVGEDTIRDIIEGIKYELKGIYLLPTNKETYTKFNMRTYKKYSDIESAIKDFKKFNK